MKEINNLFLWLRNWDAIRDFTKIGFLDNACWKNEAASDKRSIKRVMDIVARVLRKTRYGVLFSAENELPHVLRKSIAEKSNWYLWIIADKENALFAGYLWLAASGKHCKRRLQ